MSEYNLAKYGSYIFKAPASTDTTSLWASCSTQSFKTGVLAADRVKACTRLQWILNAIMDPAETTYKLASYPVDPAKTTALTAFAVSPLTEYLAANNPSKY